MLVVVGIAKFRFVANRVPIIGKLAPVSMMTSSSLQSPDMSSISTVILARIVIRMGPGRFSSVLVSCHWKGWIKRGMGE